MNKLSDRLQIIADKIETGETMADIGTDHGFLPIYLKISGISPKVVMADVSSASLQKAIDNAKKLSADTEKMDFRVGDGLSVLKPGEVDAVVIAGMGGKLIRDIMAKDPELTYSVKKFILQPRIGQGHLRKWLVENGFNIISEDLVYEGDYIPEIITALTPNKCVVKSRDGSGDDMYWKIPPWIVDAKGPLRDFLCRNIEAQNTILDNVRKSKDVNENLISKIENDILYLKKLYGEIEKNE